jgi:REP element-mobilizing transposase RayT
MIRQLRTTCDELDVDSLAWVVMPDHLHWLFVLHRQSISEVVRRVKGKSAYAINSHRGRHTKVWQHGFHDHAVRKEEDIKHIARYIIANPLRAGLVKTVGDYPHWDAIWLSSS